jgi:hypothetical protein
MREEASPHDERRARGPKHIFDGSSAEYRKRNKHNNEANQNVRRADKGVADVT